MKRATKNAEKGKAYRVIAIPTEKRGAPAVIRTTSTLQHAVKHACYAAELGLAARVEDRKGRVAIELPPIDKGHRIKPACPRDRRYWRTATA